MDTNGSSNWVGRTTGELARDKEGYLLGCGSILVGKLLLPAALCCLHVSHAALCTLSTQALLPDHLRNTTMPSECLHMGNLQTAEVRIYAICVCIHACTRIPCRHERSLPDSTPTGEGDECCCCEDESVRCGMRHLIRSLCCVLCLPLLLRQLGLLVG